VQCPQLDFPAVYSSHNQPNQTLQTRRERCAGWCEWVRRKTSSFHERDFSPRFGRGEGAERSSIFVRPLWVRTSSIAHIGDVSFSILRRTKLGRSSEPEVRKIAGNIPYWLSYIR